MLQYVAGLHRLGHEVVLVEPVRRRGAARALRGGRGGALLLSLARDLEGRAALLAPGTEQTVGLPYAELVRFASEADLLINISGMLRDERLLEPIPVRAFLDLDPGFNQVWHQTGSDMGLDLHTHFLTVGQSLGARGLPDTRLRPRAGSRRFRLSPSITGRPSPAPPATTPSPASGTGAATARSSTRASTTASAPTRCGS